MSTLYQTVQANIRTFPRFTKTGSGITLRRYQIESAEAILNSIKKGLGLSIVIIISRQAGKDEMLANLKTYLLARFSDHEVGIVEANPTYKPQTINAMDRLESRLSSNLITRMFWKKRSDFIRIVGKARCSFLSGDKEANVVGAVASLLLIINEAQDIEPAVYDKKFAPMVASTNATRIFVGTEWTSNTLLARECDAARKLQEKDGIQRVFVYTANDVRKIVPNYGKFVDGEIAKLGRQHPLVKTQYFCERIDAQGTMFNEARLALMYGEPYPSQPKAGHIHAFLVDVAGMDEISIELDGLGNQGRDSTTLSIVDIDLSSLSTLQAPTYRVVARMAWQGKQHLDIFGKLMALAELWTPQHYIIDATGVGEGLWNMLARRYPTRTIGVKFTAQTKSEIGYRFLAIIDTGRFRDHCQSETVREQYLHCQSEILIGPQKTMRWGVKDGTRGANGELIHDDYILADALVSQLDAMDWYIPSATVILEQQDPLKEMDNAY